MKFLADESVDWEIVTRLRKDGHFVLYVAEMKQGISDDVVLDLANSEKALLLTADKDFGEMEFRQQRFAPGAILIRLAGLTQARKAGIVTSAISRHMSTLPQAFTVITPGAIRIRRRMTEK